MKSSKKLLKANLLPLLLLAITILFSNAAYSQIDYYYGKNIKGLRVSAGAGFTTLITHYNSNPLKFTAVANVDYNLNEFFSIGLEGQRGTLYGVDTHYPNHLYYNSSTNKFYSGNINIKASVGLFYNFYSNNALMDAVRKFYVGAGAGVIKNDISFTITNNLNQMPYGDPQPKGNLSAFPFDFGTNIDLPGVFGTDRLSLNPNFQFTYVPSLYLDGFRSSSYSHLKGFYNFTSLNIKVKF